MMRDFEESLLDIVPNPNDNGEDVNLRTLLADIYSDLEQNHRLGEKQWTNYSQMEYSLDLLRYLKESKGENFETKKVHKFLRSRILKLGMVKNKRESWIDYSIKEATIKSYFKEKAYESIYDNKKITLTKKEYFLISPELGNKWIEKSSKQTEKWIAKLFKKIKENHSCSKLLSQ